MGFGVAGCLLKKFQYEPEPLTLALVMGPMMEQNFRAALVMFDGNLFSVFQRPVAAVILVVAAALLVAPLVLKRPEIRED